jgi:hypothetical protein
MAVATSGQIHHHFTIPQAAAREPEKPEFTQATAGAALVEARKLGVNREKLRNAEAAALKALEEAQQRYANEIERLRVERGKLDNASSRGDRARAWLIGNFTAPTAEEENLRELTKQTLLKVGQLQARSGCHASEMAPLEETEDFRELKSADAKVADLVRRADFSYESFEKDEWRQLQGKVLPELARRVAKYRQQYEAFKEVKSLKDEANGYCAKREQLQRERHDAVIAEAIKAAGK